jgi:hypothetical protein
LNACVVVARTDKRQIRYQWPKTNGAALAHNTDVSEILEIEGRRFRKNQSAGVFEVPADELGELRPFSIPIHSTIHVSGLPTDDVFGVSFEVTHAGEEEAFVFVHITFFVPRSEKGQTIASRRIKLIQKKFSVLAKEGWDDSSDDHRFQFSAERWYWIVLYKMNFGRLNNNPPLFLLLQNVTKAFTSLSGWHDILAFICHASEDKPFVDLLTKPLDEQAVGHWYDKREIKVGDSIVEKINDGLSDATHLIVVLSGASVDKSWVKREMSSSLIRQLGSRSIKLLPLLREDCTIPPLLADIKYADFRKDFDQGFTDLLDSLQS